MSNINSEQRLNKTPSHTKARLERGVGYPERFPVPDAMVSWDTEYKNYTPPYYVAPLVIEHDETKVVRGWAHPETLSLLERGKIKSFEKTVHLDNEGYPLNPHGRTGIVGRGLLGKWGANFAADPIITRNNPKTNQQELLVIYRKDTRTWALPGGMVDEGERLSQTASRELKEEAGITIDMSDARKVYEGYVDDPRNTDNAWIETVAYHIHLTPEQAKQTNVIAGDDALRVSWIALAPENLSQLYANHAELVSIALRQAYEQEK